MSSFGYVFSCEKKEQVVGRGRERVKGTIIPKKAKNLITSEGRDEEEEYGKLICPGCGLFIQGNSPDLPGYYEKIKVTATNLEVHEVEEDEIDEYEINDDEEEEEEIDEMSDEIKNAIEGSSSESESEFDWDSDEWEEKEEGYDIELDGFAPACVGYGNITEEREMKKRVSKTERKKIARDEANKSQLC